MDTKFSASSAFWRLLSRLYGEQSGEALAGDLQEEYRSRAHSNALGAAIWLVSQYSRTVLSGVWRQSGTPLGLSRIVALATLVVVPLIVGMVAWLSNMDETTPQLWNMVLAGEMHKTVFVAEYWQEQVYAISQIDDIHMFINYNSLVWAAAAMGLVMLVGNKKPDAIRAATTLGVSLMLVPYVLSLFYLEMAQLPPQKIGPVLAFTLFNVFYMLPVLALWLRRQASKAEGIEHA